MAYLLLVRIQQFDLSRGKHQPSGTRLRDREPLAEFSKFVHLNGVDMKNLFYASVIGAALLVANLTVVAAEKTAQTKAEFNAAKARAEAGYNAARSQCKNFSGNDRDICQKQAEANLTKAKAQARANYEGTGEAQLDAREDMIEADYKVAKEKCDSLSGDAKDVCLAEAKAVYAKQEATLEARGDSMEADYKVAKERCNTLSGADRRACLKEAKVKFDD